MSLSVSGVEWNAKTVRAWQLAILRFAVTLDNADRLAVLMIASEIDRLDRNADFAFFRRTSAALCAAILRPSQLSSAVLRQYLPRIDDDRLKRAFAAVIEASEPKMPSVGKPMQRDNRLWKGLSVRRNHQL
jgi:hypothetical protein